MKRIILPLFICICFVTNTFAQQQPVANFSGSPTTVCAGQSVTWTNLSTGFNGNTNYDWSFPGSTSTTSTSQNPSPKTYLTPGIYSVSLAVTSNSGDDTEVKANYITVIASPTVSITPGVGVATGHAYVGCNIPSVTLTASGGSTYKWSPATALSSTTGAIVIASPTTNITYNVIATNSNGCTSQTSIDVEYNTSPPPVSGAITGGLTTVCSGQIVGTYVVPATSTSFTPYRLWTVPAGSIVTSGQGTKSVTITFGSTSGNICCSLTNACGASAPICEAITVNQTPAIGTIGIITGPTTVCDNQVGVPYSIAPVANAATYSWTATGGANITAGQGTNTITVTFSTNNSNICVTASNSCNTSPQVCQAVTAASAIPTVPGAITGFTTVCSGQSGVNYSVASVSNATFYTWTVPAGSTIIAGQGTNSITVSYGSASGSVCATAGNGCGMSTSASCTSITVDPNPAIGIIGTITGLSVVCAGQSGVLYSVLPVSGATTYSWTLPAGTNLIGGQGTNSITVTFGTNSGNICVDASNSCSSALQSCKAIIVSPVAPSIPGAITGSTTVCNGQTGMNYSVTSVPNAITYNWTVPSGASVIKGQGTNSVTVNFGASSGTICVSAGNACGSSQGSCEIITVDPTGTVGTIGTITGTVAACANITGITYSIAPVTGAATYSWTVPAGASITAGQGTNSITVTFGTTSGNICVQASNSCSSSSSACIAITIDPIAPAIPGGITGITSVCGGQSGGVYSVSDVANATVYSWTVPVGSTITSGQGTNTIMVTFGSSSGTICVTAGNGCGTSMASCQVVTVSPTGAVGTIGAISGPIAGCMNQSLVIYSTIPVANATTYNWTVPAGSSITAGQGTPTITVTFGSTSGNICVDASNSCSSTPQSCVAVAISSTSPVIPGVITGVSTVCSGQAGAVYTIAPVANATFYTWTATAGGSVTAGQGTTVATITFGSTSGNISVTAGNACSVSLPSYKAIAVDPNPAVGAIGAISGSKATCANLTNVTYTVPAVTNAVTYNWTVPAAASITTGQGTNTITVSFGNVSGNICVVASNSCGSSPQSCMVVTVSPNAPAIPNGISGATTVCSSQIGSYSTASVVNALSYAWTVPSDATVSSGQGSGNIVVAFGTTSGNICVSAANGCGSSLQNCKPIIVGASVLTVSTTVTNTTNSSICDGSSTATPSVGTGPYTYAWTPSGAVTATATGLCFGNHTVCVTNAGGCVTCKTVNISSPTGIPILTDNGTIKVFPNPANDYIVIEGTLSSSANLHVSVINMFGQKMINESVHADGAFSQKVNIQGIPSGVYFIEISSGEMVINSKIIKIQ